MVDKKMTRYPARVRGRALLCLLALGLTLTSCGPIKSPPAATPVLDAVLDSSAGKGSVP